MLLLFAIVAESCCVANLGKNKFVKYCTSSLLLAVLAAIFKLVENEVVLAIAALAIAVWDLRGKPDQLSFWCLASYWGISYWESKSTQSDTRYTQLYA